MKKEDFKPCGYLTICNLGGIEVMINNSGDAVIYSWFGKVARRWQPIKQSAKGRDYFTINNKRYYLDEFMRY